MCTCFSQQTMFCMVCIEKVKSQKMSGHVKLPNQIANLHGWVFKIAPQRDHFIVRKIAPIETLLVLFSIQRKGLFSKGSSEEPFWPDPFQYDRGL